MCRIFSEFLPKTTPVTNSTQVYGDYLKMPQDSGSKAEAQARAEDKKESNEILSPAEAKRSK
jgi:hypothetical protein